MRVAICVLALMPVSAMAEVFTISSRASEAVIYPRGGLVTHEVAVTASTGRHELILPDLPPNLPLEALRVSANGVAIGALRYREDFVPPRDARKSADITAAEARIEELEAQIEAVRNEAKRLGLAKEAADARITFLTGLGDSDALPSNAAALAQIGAMVSAEVLAAREAAFDADLTAREVLKQLKPLKDDLERALAALAALVPEVEDRPFLSIEIAAKEDVTDVPMRISYFSYDLEWQPSYNLRLTDGENPKISLERGAQVYQATGENWQDVAVTLSTQRPSDRTGPGFLPQDLRRLFDPKEEVQKLRTTSRATTSLEADSFGQVAESARAAPAIIPEVGMQGLAVVYRIPGPVSVASGADRVRLPFDTKDFDVNLVASAVPLQDSTAYLVARFVNDTEEPILPAFGAQLFHDGGLVGLTDIAAIAAGDEAEIGFGAIDGLQLTRTVLQRAEGDRGLIVRSNEQAENVRIDVTNLTDRAWDVELLDRVPYSEQEDLEISYSAAPAPSQRDVEDRRGILQWDFKLAAGAETSITSRYEMEWPDGMQVR